METKLLEERDGLRVFAVVFRTGDEAVAGLRRVMREHRIQGARITAIGAFARATVGYFEWQAKDYRRITFDEQVEVLALAGNVAVAEGSTAPKLHAHVVLGRRDGTACGGHLLEATVRPTLEVMVMETAAGLRRRFDPETGLALIDLTS